RRLWAALILRRVASGSFRPRLKRARASMMWAGRGLPRLASDFLALASGELAFCLPRSRASGGTDSRKESLCNLEVPSVFRATPKTLRHAVTVWGVTPHQ